ncbi:hypothetical protein [Sodalis praecaptivus]|uniref:hypothetical protein n=1 Tax=Sodalis praecaptivus TaxID=1239307 RepID=UPI0027F53D0C|nr:hypothetical protein [Sodalis praecaptivus]CAJ0999768.1 hypothetical protein NVIRENTERO_03983 [Sodalis praecaptivus]
MSQVNAALHCLLPCLFRERPPHDENSPAARRVGVVHHGGPFALPRAENPLLRSVVARGQTVPMGRERHSFTARRSGQGMIVTGSWRRQGSDRHIGSASASGISNGGYEGTPPPTLRNSPAALSTASPVPEGRLQINVIYGHDLRARAWRSCTPPRYLPDSAPRGEGQSDENRGSPSTTSASSDRSATERQAVAVAPHGRRAEDGRQSPSLPLNIRALAQRRENRFHGYTCPATSSGRLSPVQTRLNRLLAPRVSPASVESGWLQTLSSALFEERQSRSRFAIAVAEHSLQQLFTLAGNQARLVKKRFRPIASGAIGDTLLQLAHLHFVVWQFLTENDQRAASALSVKYQCFMCLLGKKLGADPLTRQSAFDPKVTLTGAHYQEMTALMNELRLVVLELFDYNLFGPGNYILRLRGLPFLNHLEALYAQARGIERKERELLQEFVSADQLLRLKLQRDQDLQSGDMMNGRGYIMAVGQDIRFICGMGMLTASAVLMSERRRANVLHPAH